MPSKQHKHLTGTDLHANKIDPATGTELTAASQAAYDARWAGKAAADAHIADTNNPHATTKAQVGLGLAENTADLSKPVSTATQAALDTKADAVELQDHISDLGNPHGVTKAQVGLGEVQNLDATQRSTHTGTQSADTIIDGTTNHVFTAADDTKLAGIATGATANSTDAQLRDRATHTGTQSADTLIDGTTNKAFLATERTKLAGIATGATANDTDANLKNRANHTGTQTAATISDFSTAADARIAAQKGQANGVASLDASSKVPAAQLPSYVDDVLEYANTGAFPGTGTAGVIYVALDMNKTYRWGGSAYAEISASPGSTDAVPEGATNLYHTISRASAAAPVQSVASKTGAVTLVKGDVGLGNVDNTSDANKPVSTATQTALNLKANDNAVVHLTVAETVAGIKTFSSSPIVPTPGSGTDAANKSYVDTGLGTKAATVHTHAQSDVTSLTTDLAAKVNDTGDTLTGALNFNVATGTIGVHIGTAGGSADSHLIRFTSRADVGYDGSTGDAYLKGKSGKGVKLFVNDSTVALSINSSGSATFIGTVTLAADPTAALHAATKQYTDKKQVAYTVGLTDGDYSVSSYASANAAINAAISAANAAGGGTVRLRPVTFLIVASVTMLSNVTLEGSGPGTVIKVGGTGCHGIVGTSVSNIQIRDLTVDGSKGDVAVTSDSHAIRLETCTNVRVVNVVAHDAIHHNMITPTCANMVIDGFYSYAAGDPVKVTNADGVPLILGPTASNVKVVNCTFDDAAYHGLQVYNSCQGVLVSNCYITNTGQRSGSGCGIQIHPACEDIHISNCFVSACQGGGSGIHTETTTGNPINGVLIENCTVELADFAGVRLEGTTNACPGYFGRPRGSRRSSMISWGRHWR